MENKNEGLKYDQEKNRLDLIDPIATEELAKVLTYGAGKYGAHNWRKGMAWMRLIGAALRHIFAWVRGESADPETGLSHLAHAQCCLMFLLNYELTNTGTDDRARPNDARVDVKQYDVVITTKPKIDSHPYEFFTQAKDGVDPFSYAVRVPTPADEDAQYIDATERKRGGGVWGTWRLLAGGRTEARALFTPTDNVRALTLHEVEDRIIAWNRLNARSFRVGDRVRPQARMGEQQRTGVITSVLERPTEASRVAYEVTVVNTANLSEPAYKKTFTTDMLDLDHRVHSGAVYTKISDGPAPVPSLAEQLRRLFGGADITPPDGTPMPEEPEYRHCSNGEIYVGDYYTHKGDTFLNENRKPRFAVCSKFDGAKVWGNWVNLYPWLKANDKPLEMYTGGMELRLLTPEEKQAALAYERVVAVEFAREEAAPEPTDDEDSRDYDSYPYDDSDDEDDVEDEDRDDDGFDDDTDDEDEDTLDADEIHDTPINIPAIGDRVEVVNGWHTGDVGTMKKYYEEDNEVELTFANGKSSFYQAVNVRTTEPTKPLSPGPIC